jgi:magnesium-transporting ATPase (P-type)
MFSSGGDLYRWKVGGDGPERLTRTRDRESRGRYLPDGSGYAVTGEGVGPGGRVEGADIARLREICITGVLANESYLDYSGGEWASNGDIVDVAFLVFAKKLGLSLSDIRSRQKQLDLIPYESERAFSGSLDLVGDEPVIHVKGSPEKILGLSTHMMIARGRVPIDPAIVETQFDALARQGYRVIALAERPAASEAELGDLRRGAEAKVEGMTFLGMVAMMDPIRPEARDAIARCRAGGVEVAMVTGDHPATARAIAADLGTADLGEDKLSERFIDRVKELCKELNIPEQVEALNKADIGSIAKDALKEAHYLYPVPKYMDQRQCTAILTRMLP